MGGLGGRAFPARGNGVSRAAELSYRSLPALWGTCRLRYHLPPRKGPLDCSPERESLHTRAIGATDASPLPRIVRPCEMGGRQVGGLACS